MNKKLAYRLTTVVIAALFMITGIGNVLAFTHIAADMAHLGYPDYFLTILGSWKMLAAITILTPGISRAKEWAFAGMMLDLTGGALSRFFVSDDLVMVLIPLAISLFVIVNYLLGHSIIKEPAL